MTQIFKKIVRLVLVIYVFSFAYQWALPTPESITTAKATVYFVDDTDVHFFSDETYIGKNGKREVKQEIWDQIFSTISNAKRMILLDMFLFNDYQGAPPETTRKLSQELTDNLILKRTTDPHTAIAFITDPINTVYGGFASPQIESLATHGVFLVTTNLKSLRDSNLVWSAFWRPFVSYFSNSTSGGIFPHPFQAGGSKVTLRSWLALLNMKANHRKLIVADEPVALKGKGVSSQVVTIVTSSNPHDGSSAHGNIALKVDKQIWKDVIQNERQIAEQADSGLPSFEGNIQEDESGTIQVSFLHEKQIREKALEIISGTKKGDSVDLAMFYLSERAIIRELIDASNRGVSVRVILDPNKDAFGHQKNGIPNRPVAKELDSQSGHDIVIKWCDTHGEQCHAKLFMGKTASSTFLMVGSANFTRRNIGGFNLEGDILATQETPFTAWNDAQSYFNRMWNNTDGVYTTPYETYRDETLWKSSLYRMMERTGLSSF